ncbi:MAG: hypothetical protein BWY06_02778 [Candidatus Latescibacteria bacterium ADurb.Bin168]|nr:MAG: hypothetical protein BWY06_02778 [Candidatus Latescibacteria bacterium ADurb.Bin168]
MPRVDIRRFRTGQTKNVRMQPPCHQVGCAAGVALWENGAGAYDS